MEDTIIGLFVFKSSAENMKKKNSTLEQKLSDLKANIKDQKVRFNVNQRLWVEASTTFLKHMVLQTKISCWNYKQVFNHHSL